MLRTAALWDEATKADESDHFKILRHIPIVEGLQTADLADVLGKANTNESTYNSDQQSVLQSVSSVVSTLTSTGSSVSTSAANHASKDEVSETKSTSAANHVAANHAGKDEESETKSTLILGASSLKANSTRVNTLKKSGGKLAESSNARADTATNKEVKRKLGSTKAPYRTGNRSSTSKSAELAGGAQRATGSTSTAHHTNKREETARKSILVPGTLSVPAEATGVKCTNTMTFAESSKAPAAAATGKEVRPKLGSTSPVTLGSVKSNTGHTGSLNLTDMRSATKKVADQETAETPAVLQKRTSVIGASNKHPKGARKTKNENPHTFFYVLKDKKYRETQYGTFAAMLRNQ